MLKPIYLKIYGLPRSGTNYLQFMIERNLKIYVLNTKKGWKHGRIQSDEITSVAIFKNPFSWLVSVYAFAIKRPKIFHINPNISFKDYIRKEFVMDTDISGPGSEHVYQLSSNPIQHWNYMNDHWFSHADFWIRYEDLLDRAQCLEHIANFFRIKVKEFVYPNTRIDPGRSRNVGTTPNQNFIPNEYMNLYEKEDIDFVNKELNPILCERLNYAQR